MAGTFVSAAEEPWSGALPLSAGLPAVLRIPVPQGGGRLAIELSPRGWTPKGGTTSSVFIQDITGKRHLRLDYGFNKNANRIEWHWNQKGTAAELGITNHTTVGRGTQTLGTAMKYFKYAGRSFAVVGVAMDVYSIVVASSPLRRSVQVVSAWGAAALGCRGGGQIGAGAGTLIEPGGGTIVGGILGCAAGGFFGYWSAEKVSGYVFDWANGTFFSPVGLSPQP